MSEYAGRCMDMRTDDTLISGVTARRRPGTDHCGQSTLQRRRRARLTARNATSARVLADLLLR